MAISLTWKIGGEAGAGIMAAGAILSKTFSRAGLQIATLNEYPSLVRGGHNSYTVRAAEQEIFSVTCSVDLLVALNQETIDLHKDELSKEGAIVYDPDDKSISPPSNTRTYPIPLLKLATQNGGPKLMMNNVALGATLAIIGLPFEILAGVISDTFGKKGQKIVEDNTGVAELGYKFIRENFTVEPNYKLEKTESSRKLVLTGNEAIGLGAIKAKLRFACLYPMTPINGLLHYLAANQAEGGYFYFQPEDEIAAVNMAIGASYSGARSLVASSGGGFCLMVEGLSLAAMTETPLVIVMGTRPGPSTGLATWTGQTDLQFLLSASQGDFKRVILAPGDCQECFEMTQVAFNLADCYQTPVFLLVDKFLCESLATAEESQIINSKITVNRGKDFAREQEYQRYKITDDGISPRALPGQTFFVTSSYEHDEEGLSTEDREVIKKMVEKRGRKYTNLAKEIPPPSVFGNKDAEIALIGFGSTKNIAREAINILKGQGIDVCYIHLNYLNPLPVEIDKLLSKAKKVIDVEGNSTGQLATWIRSQTGFEIKEKILKYDGRPFFPEDIIEGVKKYA